jgi:transcriptional regulator with XRE-family HTH domain
MQKPEAKYKNPVVDVLKELRKERGVTQRELASLLKLSQTRIAHLESGRDILNEETKNKVLFK